MSRFIFSMVFAVTCMAQNAPVLQYGPLPNFYRSAATPPDNFEWNEANGSIQVYPFRPFQGPIEQMFQRTLLREWIDPQFREQSVTAAPVIRRATIEGAQLVLAAQFAENVMGMAKPRLRVLIVAGGSAAIVDASTSSPSTWPRMMAILDAWQVRVESGAAPRAVTGNAGPESTAVAGLYEGMKSRYVYTGAGFSQWVTALHYYLFSPDGRVYRAYDEIGVPGGDPARFDFEAARRRDPVNSGRYIVSGGQLIMEFEGSPVERIAVKTPSGGRVTIGGISYERQ